MKFPFDCHYSLRHQIAPGLRTSSGIGSREVELAALFARELLGRVLLVLDGEGRLYNSSTSPARALIASRTSARFKSSTRHVAPSLTVASIRWNASPDRSAEFASP